MLVRICAGGGQRCPPPFASVFEEALPAAFLKPLTERFRAEFIYGLPLRHGIRVELREKIPPQSPRFLTHKNAFSIGQRTSGDRSERQWAARSRIPVAHNNVN